MRRAILAGHELQATIPDEEYRDLPIPSAEADGLGRAYRHRPAGLQMEAVGRPSDHAMQPAPGPPQFEFQGLIRTYVIDRRSRPAFGIMGGDDGESRRPIRRERFAPKHGLGEYLPLLRGHAHHPIPTGSDGHVKDRMPLPGRRESRRSEDRPDLGQEAPACRPEVRPFLGMHFSLSLGHGPIAQRLEHGTHNSLVLGSNPGGPTLFRRTRPAQP